MRRPDVGIVIVTYNSAEWIDRCLGSLAAALDHRTAQVVVVDNASSDASADIVEQRHPEVSLVRNAVNVGFAAAVNQGARMTAAPWLLLLNPDMEARPMALANLLAFADANPGHGLYGGRTLTTDGRLERSSCWGLPSIWSLTCFAVGLTTLFHHSAVFDPESLGGWQRDTVREVGMITGCLLLVERRCWEELGGLDERFFVYGEDADFSARARAAGLRPIITPSAEVVHAVGKSSSGPGGSMPLVLAGKVTYAHSHFSPAQARVAVALLQFGVAARAGASRLTGRGGKWATAWSRRRTWVHGFPTVPPVRGSAPTGRGIR